MDAPDKPHPDKKPYRAPALQAYGDLARITNAVGSSGQMGDGGGLGMTKTS